MLRRTFRSLVPVSILVLAGVFAAAAEPHAPQVELRVRAAADGRSEVWVHTTSADGGVRARRVRTTEATPRPRDGGSEPSGAGVFARWTESGETWFSFSRDGGHRWAEARPLVEELRLLAGTVRPGDGMPAPAPGLASGADARVFLVELKTISLPEWRAALDAAGVERLGWFPRNAHLVRAEPERIAALRALPFVQRVEPYHPDYRLDSRLRDWLADPDVGPSTFKIRAVAFEWGPGGKARIAAAADAAGATILSNWPTGHLVELEVDRAQLRRLAAHDDVMWIDRWSAPQTDMDLVREDGGTNYVENTLGFCGQGVRAEVMDSGLQTDHVDLDNALLHTNAGVDSHGTSTYGIVFGNGDRDGDGQAAATGHMPCAEQGIFAQYNQFGDRFTHTQELLDAPYFAVFQTNSWGDDRTFDYTSISQQMDDIIWRLDFPITQSQSNAGNQDSRPQAWAKNIISVGGIRHYNTLDTSDDAWNGGASIGPAADGRIKPDVNYWYDSIYTTTTGNGYTQFSGTSAATPEVAGILGLMHQMWAENVWGNDPDGTTVFEKRPHATTSKALLINNANQYPFSGTGHDLTRVHQGWGRPSLELAYDRAPSSFIVDEEFELALDESNQFQIDVQEGETELKITMVYADPPGVTSASLHRINDVNLKVTSPDAVVYWGNVGLDGGNTSLPGGAPNTVDTVENVFVQDPEPGVWTVEVEAVEVNQDAVLGTPEVDVTYALVVTGATGTLCDQPLVTITATPNPARVGDAIQYDSTVTPGAGAGGPYEYFWDFTRDGIVDSHEEDPVFVFDRPYAGESKLRVRDASDCPQSDKTTLEITGPDLRLDSWLEPVEIVGNGNGSVDPGETIEVRLRLRNDGNETAVGTSARLLVDPDSPGPISMLIDHATFPDIPVGGTADSLTGYRFHVGDAFVCGSDALFGVFDIATQDPGNVYPPAPASVSILVGGAGDPIELHTDGFETNTGWSSLGGGEWQLAPPQGLGGQSSVPGQIPKPDPTSAYDGTHVMGNDLTGLGAKQGNYESNISSSYTSFPIDMSGASEVELRFARWLNTEAGDTAYIDMTANGIDWTRIYEDSTGVTENVWSEQSYDVSAVADAESQFRVRFGIVSDVVAVQGGWNVDLFRLFGVTRASCSPFTAADPGAVQRLDVDRDGAGDLVLAWTEDCGGGDTYAVYRGDLSSGYGSLTSENCAVSGTTTVVSPGAPAGEFFLVVPLASGDEGSYGEATSGPRAPAAAACGPAGALSACVP